MNRCLEGWKSGESTLGRITLQRQTLTTTALKRTVLPAEARETQPHGQPAETWKIFCAFDTAFVNYPVFQNGIFFSRVWVNGRKPRLREELRIPAWEDAGQCLCDRLPALSLCRGRVPPLTFCMAQLKGLWCHKWCLPVQRHTHKWCHLFQGHTQRGQLNTQLHLSPSQPLLSPVLHYGNKYLRFAKAGTWTASVLPSLAVFLPPSGPWIPHLENEGNDSAFLLRLL